jgi:hypothetical protein
MEKSKQKKVNKLDELVENLTGEFSKIKNFDLLQTDPVGKEVFDIVAFRIADISSFKELVIKSFIPAVNKAIFDTIKEFQGSKYRTLLKDDSLFKETRYETIRLAYVGLFHKIESLVNDVLKVSDIIFNEEKPSAETVENFSKRRFNFKIKDWQQFYITHRINWICNCVKHYDGFPKKEPKPMFFGHLAENKRIQLTAEGFKSDSELFLTFAPIYLQIIYAIGSFKRDCENFDREEWKDYPDTLKSHEEYEAKALDHILDFIKKARDLGNKE